MKLIPAIDLLKGKCVRLVKGDFNQKKEFGNDPVKQAEFWEKEGAKCIHIVDLPFLVVFLPRYPNTLYTFQSVAFPN